MDWLRAFRHRDVPMSPGASWWFTMWIPAPNRTSCQELKPAVLVWDVETLALVSELKGHLFGVGCIAFSPYGRHLVSVGGYIHLWEWRIGMLVTKLKASASCSAISSVSFSLDAKFVITAGKKHLMFWTFRSSPKTRISKGNVSMTMHGKAVNLGLQKGRSFISVTSSLRTDKTTMCGQAGEFFPLYALTDAGVLCLIHSGLSVRKSMDLKKKASKKLIVCACSSRIVRLFTIETLEYAGSLSYSKDKKGGGIGNNDIFLSYSKDKKGGGIGNNDIFFPNKDVETDFQL
ncbi:mitogen-activated protein kinase-binding protein 1 [Morus notabilis]|uniref:mitogen-activated protein kinase-binding protein 1 n=1 Tax=Morus notabilis TaxID=981085 RepID=UPI000CED3D74|nr:mitogen-activated protein kinase-binding protein 1 [Morus notabilis]